MSVTISTFSSRDADFQVRLDKLRAFESAQNVETDRRVTEILGAVRTRGDEALLEYTIVLIVGNPPQRMRWRFPVSNLNLHW